MDREKSDQKAKQRKKNPKLTEINDDSQQGVLVKASIWGKTPSQKYISLQQGLQLVGDHWYHGDDKTPNISGLCLVECFFCWAPIVAHVCQLVL